MNRLADEALDGMTSAIDLRLHVLDEDAPMHPAIRPPPAAGAATLPAGTNVGIPAHALSARSPAVNRELTAGHLIRHRLGMADPKEPLNEAGNLEARVVVLEGMVSRLRAEIQRLSSPVPARPLAPPMTAKAPAAGPIRAAPPAPSARIDFEVLVGRYGMLGAAVILALAAVGTFVGWAVRHGLLGPGPRVLLGLFAAIAFAAWGVRLRRRERSFSASLLGLSLAITHVCAWAAGPSLRLVPPSSALALAAVASIGLAAFALIENDEPLWCVGFGGAAFAPFTTSTGQGTAPLLATYALAVLIAGGSALASRAWRVAGGVFAGATALFVVALSAMPVAQHGPLLAMALPLLVAIAAVFPFARGAVLRPKLRTLGFLAAAAALIFAARSPDFGGVWAIAIAGLAWLALVDRADSEPVGSTFDGFGSISGAAEWLEGFVIPGGFVLAAAIYIGDDPTRLAALCGVAAAVLYFVASRRPGGALRDACAASSSFAALAATIFASAHSDWATPAALAGTSVLLLLLSRALPSRSFLWFSRLGHFVATGWAVYQLADRPAYRYVPFATAASAAAGAVLLGWAAALALSDEDRSMEVGSARLGLFGFAFLFVNIELVHAVSPETSTLLLVTFYAVTSVVAVWFGRRHGIASLRHAGLALGLVAAGMALRAAANLESTGARIAADAVASAFLLGIAWWYRRPGLSRGSEDEALDAQPGSDARG